MAYDVFISYASKDKIIADAVCARLEASGIRCWIAPRDIVAGTSYGEAIIEAIHVAKVMVLVFSSSANSSGHIPKEVERAVSNGLTILPFRIEDVAPGKSLDYFIGSVHWLDAMTPPMEQHLDALATTVHKLLPARPGEPDRPVPPTSGVWQRSAPPAAVPAAIAAPVPATSTTANKSSSKMILIGAAIVAVLALAVWGAMALRGGDSPAPGGGTPGATVTPETPNTPAAAVIGGVDPIVGCYQWFNNAPVVIRANGTMVVGPFTGHWRRVSPNGHEYRFTWPEAVDTVTVAVNQQSLSGANQYGYPASGTRMAGTSGLVGAWRWPNGVPVVVNANGTFSAGAFRGKWRGASFTPGIYMLTWPSPIDSVTLSADASRISGANQYGVAISGSRTGACAGN